ncbi:glycine zipper 2TM domain-containing protein [Caulobacter sp. S45]|uniref:glycine zipper 2TM domain-containing protein n=1 Tax=Caulobacter sp. S45 TaxID=1641861 RepID=UPI0015776D8C|nr:glycine zipper 2TM domain-containing protein [Caulobacter sp. S45]
MKKKLILAGAMAAVLPSAALAQPPNPACVQSNQNSRVEGTVLGAGAGAVLGSVLAGRHSRGEGAVLGAVGGGVAGNVIAGQRNDPCPPGYYYPQPGYGAPPPAYGPVGAGGFWRGAPTDVRARIDFLQQRINRLSANGRISPGEAQQAYARLSQVRRYARNNYQRYGQLTPDQQGYVQSQLDYVGRSLRWEASYGY